MVRSGIDQRGDVTTMLEETTERCSTASDVPANIPARACRDGRRPSCGARRERRLCRRTLC